MWQQLQDIGGRTSVNRKQEKDPYLEKTVEYILELEKAGASLIQIGIPFSDPIAEGVVVQEANIRALSKNMTTDKVFQIVKEVRKTSDIPIFKPGFSLWL